MGNPFKATTSDVGGGGAKGVADNFSTYLGQHMQGGLPTMALNSMLAGRPGDPSSLQQYFGAGLGQTGGVQGMLPQASTQFNPTLSNNQFNPANSAVGSTYGGTQIGVNSTPAMLQGGWTPQGIRSEFSGQQVQGGFTPQNVSTQYTGPQVNSQYNAPSFTNANLNTGLTLPSQASMMGGMGQRANLQDVVNPAAQVEAMRALMERQSAREIGDLRARFGNQALGTGAQYAESQYRAEATPRIGLAADEIYRQNNALELQERGQDLQNQQGGRGMDIQQMQQALAAAGMSNEAILGLNAQQLQQTLAQNQFNQGNAQFGSTQNMQAQLANQNNAQFGATFGQQGQIANNQFAQQSAAQQLQAALANQQNAQFDASFGQQGDIASNQFGQAAAGQRLQAAMANQNAVAQAQALAQQGQIATDESLRAAGSQGLQAQVANAQNAQFGANFGLQQNQQNNAAMLDAAKLMQGNQNININAMLQNQQMVNDWNKTMQGVGVQRENNATGAQTAGLATIMQALMQTQRLGTPQADLAVQEGWGTQTLGFLGGLADIGKSVTGMRTPQAPGGNGMGGYIPQGGGVPTNGLPPNQRYGLQGSSNANADYVPGGVQSIVANGGGGPTMPWAPGQAEYANGFRGTGNDDWYRMNPTQDPWSPLYQGNTMPGTTSTVGDGSVYGNNPLDRTQRYQNGDQAGLGVFNFGGQQFSDGAIARMRQNVTGTGMNEWQQRMQDPAFAGAYQMYQDHARQVTTGNESQRMINEYEQGQYQQNLAGFQQAEAQREWDNTNGAAWGQAQQLAATLGMSPEAAAQMMGIPVRPGSVSMAPAANGMSSVQGDPGAGMPLAGNPGVEAFGGVTQRTDPWMNPMNIPTRMGPPTTFTPPRTPTGNDVDYITPQQRVDGGGTKTVANIPWAAPNGMPSNVYPNTQYGQLPQAYGGGAPLVPYPVGPGGMMQNQYAPAQYIPPQMAMALNQFMMPAQSNFNW